MRYWLVMPAAGSGRRFGERLPKQYAALHARTVIEWSLAPFLEDDRCVGAVVVIAENDSHWPAVQARMQTGDQKSRLSKCSVAIGGAERSLSVRHGLARLQDRAAAEDWILVHDAARPCIRRQDLDRLLDQGQRHPVGAILAVPATDTLKRAAGEQVRGGQLGEARSLEGNETSQAQLTAAGEILQTVERAGLWRAMTPQMFRFERLCEALDRALLAGRTPTDEAQALEWTGRRALLVQGSSTNLKITSADDLVVAAALLTAAADAAGDGAPRP